MERWKWWQVVLVPYSVLLLAQVPNPQLSQVFAAKCHLLLRIDCPWLLGATMLIAHPMPPTHL